MDDVLFHHPWIHFYLVYVAALAIVLLCATPRSPRVGPRPDRWQGSDRGGKPTRDTTPEKRTDTRITTSTHESEERSS
jgi:hypothetical protein